MVSTAKSTEFPQLPKRKRGETSKRGSGEPVVKRLKNEEAEDPDEQWRLRMRKARQLKQHNRAMGRPVNRGVNKLMNGSVPLATAIQDLEAPFKPQSKARPLSKAKAHTKSTKSDKPKSQNCSGEARITGSASGTDSRNRFAIKTTSSQVKVVRNTFMTSEGKADPKTESKQQKKELEEQQFARVAFESKKEPSRKPITLSKNEESDYGKAPSTFKYMSKSTPSISVSAAEEVKATSLDGTMKPMSGPYIGSKRKAGAIETSKIKKRKLAGDLNQIMSVQVSANGAKECEQRQPSLPATAAAGTQSSDEIESSDSEMSDSLIIGSSPEIVKASQQSPLNRCRLVNHGHSSYFNAVIQALYSLNAFVTYCTNVDADVITCDHINVKYENMVTVLGTSELDRKISHAKRLALKEAFDSAKERYNCAAQLSVYFRFMQILERVDLAFLMNVVGSLTALPEADFQGYNGECPEDVAELLVALLGVLKNEDGDNAVRSLFGEGTVAKQIKCLECGHVSVKHAAICSPLNLAIPSNTAEITLSDLLDLYSAGSKMTQHECKIDGCKKQTEAAAKVVLGRIADCLIIKIKHSDEESDDAPPLYTQLRAPTEPIDLSSWSHHPEGKSSTNRWYGARSIVLRSLTENGRDHYTIIRKEQDNTWVHFDDDKEPVEVSPADMVIGQYEISLIFMEKIA